MRWFDPESAPAGVRGAQVFCATVFGDHPDDPNGRTLDQKIAKAMQICSKHDEQWQARPRWIKIGRELCPETGRPHGQAVFMTWQKMEYVSNLAMKRLGLRVFGGNGCGYVAPMYSTIEQCSKYCGKDGKAQEAGSVPAEQQGKRTDLLDINEMILEGEITSLDECWRRWPLKTDRYERMFKAHLRMYEQLQRRGEGTLMPRGIIYHGATGAGKSHRMFYRDGRMLTTEELYLWDTDDKGWQDHYTGQDIVGINDVGVGDVPFKTMLRMTDKWPFNVPRRHIGSIPFTSKEVILTMSEHPSLIWPVEAAQPEVWAQLLRRYEIIEVIKPIGGWPAAVPAELAEDSDPDSDLEDQGASSSKGKKRKRTLE